MCRLMASGAAHRGQQPLGELGVKRDVLENVPASEGCDQVFGGEYHQTLPSESDAVPDVFLAVLTRLQPPLEPILEPLPAGVDRRRHRLPDPRRGDEPLAVPYTVVEVQIADLREI